jgi:hypothetical protein
MRDVKEPAAYHSLDSFGSFFSEVQFGNVCDFRNDGFTLCILVFRPFSFLALFETQKHACLLSATSTLKKVVRKRGPSFLSASILVLVRLLCFVSTSLYPTSLQARSKQITFLRPEALFFSNSLDVDRIIHTDLVVSVSTLINTSNRPRTGSQRLFFLLPLNPSTSVAHWI